MHKRVSKPDHCLTQNSNWALSKVGYRFLTSLYRVASEVIGFIVVLKYPYGSDMT